MRRLTTRHLEIVSRVSLAAGLALLSLAAGVLTGIGISALASAVLVAPLPHPLPRVYHGRHRYGVAPGTEAQRLRWGVDWTEAT